MLTVHNALQVYAVHTYDAWRAWIDESGQDDRLRYIAWQQALTEGWRGFAGNPIRPVTPRSLPYVFGDCLGAYAAAGASSLAGVVAGVLVAARMRRLHSVLRWSTLVVSLLAGGLWLVDAIAKFGPLLGP